MARTDYSRRKFLQYSGLATTSMLLPNFLAAAQYENIASNGKRLVIIQLSGGNDGLNTVVPVRNDIYYRSRPVLALQKQEVILLNEETGLHPEMTAMAELYENGLVNIINQVGYPNPNRSHFRSMDIWHTAVDADKIVPTGWIGRYLDAACGKNTGSAHLALEIDDMLSLALKGEYAKALSFSDPQKLYKSVSAPFYQQIMQLDPSGQQNEVLNYLYKTLAETASSADFIYEKSNIFRSSTTYPSTQFGKSMKTIAELILSGMDTRIYYSAISGFDSHANQRNIQTRLLKQVSEAIGALVHDLQSQQAMKDTVIMVFSEFGRRVEQNASNGTDHGAANNIFIIGEQLKRPGLFNGPVDLSDLDEGDVRHSIDFRQIYATLLHDWLGADDSAILGKYFQRLALV